MQVTTGARGLLISRDHGTQDLPGRFRLHSQRLVRSRAVGVLRHDAGIRELGALKLALCQRYLPALLHILSRGLRCRGQQHAQRDLTHR